MNKMKKPRGWYYLDRGQKIEPEDKTMILGHWMWWGNYKDGRPHLQDIGLLRTFK